MANPAIRVIYVSPFSSDHLIDRKFRELKGTVQQDLRGVKSGINQYVSL
jgi:hypothetical protein